MGPYLRSGVGAEVGEAWPSDCVTCRAAGDEQTVHCLTESALDVVNQGLALVGVLLEARLFNKRVDGGVAGLVVLAVGAEAAEGAASLGPVLVSQQTDRTDTGAAGGGHVGPTFVLTVTVADVGYVFLGVVDGLHLAGDAGLGEKAVEHV